MTSTPGRALAKVVSILRQENHFVTRLTVRELVGFGRFPHSQGRLTAADHVKIDEAMAFLDLTELSGRYSTSCRAVSASERTSRWSSRRTLTTSCSTSR